MNNKFVDEKNFLLTEELKSTFMQSIFDKTRSKYFPGGIVTVKGNKYEVFRVSHTKKFVILLKNSLHVF